MSYSSKYPLPEYYTFDELVEEKKNMDREIYHLEAKIKLLMEQIQLYKYILFFYEMEHGYTNSFMDPNEYPF